MLDVFVDRKMLTFPESYFKTEEIEGFTVEAMMKRAWAASLEVYAEVKRICEKHGIEIFADYGTMLGAIRHKGYVPWDDDLDFCMRREDWMKFKEVAPTELDEFFVMSSLYNNPNHTNAILRINNGEHICFDKPFLERFHDCPYVVGIDIFPMDYIPRDKEKSSRDTNIIRLVMEAAASVAPNPPYDEKVWKLVESVERMTGERINRDNNLVHEFKLLVDKLSDLCDREDADAICHMVPYVLDNNLKFSLSSYLSGIEMTFENVTVNVPVGYEEILSCIYGSDYMIPKFGYAGHDYPFYRKQRDSFKEVLEKEFNTSISDDMMDKLIWQKIINEKMM